MRNLILIILFPLFVLFWLACQGGEREAELPETTAIAEQEKEAEDSVPEIKITSPAFVQGGTIPARYTCDGDDICPEMSWKNVPEEAVSLAMIVDDPDAPGGTWIHCVAYNISPADTSISTEEIAAGKEVVMGKNSWGKMEYGGPCPPSGTHRYFFKIYALDKELELEPGATKEDLLKAMEGHILARGELMGTYHRRG
ncbi:MAG: YbhB/YbcL family Raf kinase inhibitor-like protein [candidate division Zixibacteria bacterium]|nr:YbhB/YbcL family Raf kinase inhibitor-like protein [candidate division Zixibacteria bacterium]NIR67270.1 YbhB/YbcL family Raf kinase inhibitor-like protein [candidate division Zixibacteria bacterium]NIS16106.1 YbhB/YbcL family Raf kinase inhibitor-like protein [candidate division Zixibacteria bacterium]NIS48653.1 YbhB/YbcL family Raf kinase inhibitor-like protein [candidate division Zixibacteria bacterium]NIT53520.1 YbhB/YbcL family Raf kinase inhibitor-like protein [candidate division Zixib